MDVENDVNRMGVSGWRKISRDRDTWQLILEKEGSYMDRIDTGEEEEEEEEEEKKKQKKGAVPSIVTENCIRRWAQKDCEPLLYMHCKER